MLHTKPSASPSSSMQNSLSAAAPGGSSDKEFPNGVRDQGRNGETLKDFVNHPYSRQAGLTEAHMIALRLYTTSAFMSLNTPLRDIESKEPHPFPVTIRFIAEAIKQLRSVVVAQDGTSSTSELWRFCSQCAASRSLSTMAHNTL